MGAIKGVGDSAVEAMIEERDRGADPTGSLPDLCRRVDLQRVNRRVFEALIRSGCLDRIGANRASLTAELDRAVHLGEQNSRAMSVGQVDLFGLAAAEDTVVAGVERRAAAGGRARDTRAVPDGPPDHALRAGSEDVGGRPARRCGRSEARRGQGGSGR